MSEAPDEWDESFERAMRLRDEERYEEAVELLKSLVVDRVDRRSRLVAAYCQLGNIYLFHFRDFSAAEASFRRSIGFKPSSELSSLGLFHSLMKQRRISDALDEMERFTSQYPSAEYDQLRIEMAEGRSKRGEE